MNFAQLWSILFIATCSTVYAAKVKSPVKQEPTSKDSTLARNLLATTSIDSNASLNLLENLSVALEACIVTHELDVCETIFSKALEKTLMLAMVLNVPASQKTLQPVLERHPIVRWHCYMKGHQDPTHFYSSLCTDFSIQDVERIFNMPSRISRLRVSMLIHLLDHSDDSLYSVYSVAKQKAAPILDDLIMDTLQMEIRIDKHKPIVWKETGLCFSGVEYFAKEFPTDLARVLSVMASSSSHQSSFIVKYGPLLCHLFLPPSDGQALKRATKSIASFDIDYIFALDFYLQISQSLSKTTGATESAAVNFSLSSEFLMEIADRVLSRLHPPRNESKAAIDSLLESHVPNVSLLMKDRSGSQSSDGQKQPTSWKILELVERVYANDNNRFAALLPPPPDYEPDANIIAIDNKRIIAGYPVFGAYQICLTLLRGHQCASILESPVRSVLELIEVPAFIGDLLDVFPGVRWALIADLKGISVGYNLRFTPQSLRMAMQGYTQGIDDQWMYSLIAGVKGVMAKKPYLSSLFLDIAPRLLPRVLTHKEMQACANRDWRSCGPFCNILNLTLKVAPHLFTDDNVKFGATHDLLQQIQILDKVLNKGLWTKLGDIKFTGDWLSALEVYLYLRKFHVSDPEQQPIVIKLGELIGKICVAEGHLNRVNKKELLIATYLLKYRVPRVAEVYFKYHQTPGTRARSITEVDFLAFNRDADNLQGSLQSMDPITWALVIHGYGLDNLGLIPVETLPVKLQIMFALLSGFRRFPERFPHIDPTHVCHHKSLADISQVTPVVWQLPDLSDLGSLPFEEYRVFRDALIDVFLHVAFKLPLYSTHFARNRFKEEDYLTYKEFTSFATFTLDRYCFTHHDSTSAYKIVPHLSQSQLAPELEEEDKFSFCNNYSVTS